MKVIILNVGDKKYTSVKVTAHMAKEAMIINRDAIELSKLGTTLTETADVNSAADLFDKMIELSDRKVNLICEVFGDKVTADEIENNLGTDEIDSVVNNIIYGITGVIEKN